MQELVCETIKKGELPVLGGRAKCVCLGVAS